MAEDYRIEKDSMGDVHVPIEAHFGAQTVRAVNNFPISGYRIPDVFLQALGFLKASAASANRSLGTLPQNIASLIEQKALQIAQGKYIDQFPIDVFQTGSGTSWNMNINEVIASLCNEEINHVRGGRSPVHPNDHVNHSQSSNCIIPSALNVSNRLALGELSLALESLQTSLKSKTLAFKDIIKIGRTHLQDAVPMTVGQEFSAFEALISKSLKRLKDCYSILEEIPFGGTAIGTGLNAPDGFKEGAIKALNDYTKISFRSSDNLFEGISAREPQMALMGALNGLAVSLMKIAQDLRILSSGPRTGLGELILPSLQPGSSIMPGKVNPVIPEMVIQVAAHIMGKYQAVTIACQNSPLQLNIMMPLLAFETLEAIRILTNAVTVFSESCIKGIEVDSIQCQQQVEWSLALVTPLATKIGYDEASRLAYRAYKEKRTIQDIVLDEGLITEEEASIIFDPKGMV
ncbi:class II fumarate hydratase [Spirochaeta cellobiosiphila]|uniref:class II fumarate hydratase n=1 Tax=Spirochaeta cellobiosiphila TaxID=504483 RepID=UPI00040796B2|nr:class II fumarate hydratase [Spirochaeta cellobiosiphila]